MKVRANTFSFIPQQYLTIGLIAAVLASLVLYIFFIERAVFDTAARVRLERMVSATASRVGDLETAYIAAENKMTIDTATTYNLHEVTSTQFLSRKVLTTTLSFNEI